MGQCQSKNDKAVQDTSTMLIDPPTPNASRRNRSKGSQIENNATDSLLPSKNMRPSRAVKNNSDGVDYSHDNSHTRKTSTPKRKKSRRDMKTTSQSQRNMNRAPPKDSRSHRSMQRSSQLSARRLKNHHSTSMRSQNSKSSAMFPQIKKSSSRKSISSSNDRIRKSPRKPQSKYNHPPIPPEWKTICQRHLHKLVPPIDVTTAIDERISSIIHLLEPAQIFRVQRRLRKIMRELKSPSAEKSSDPHSSVSSIIPVSNTAKEKSKLILSKDRLLDETIFRSVFAGGDGILIRGWESDRPWLHYKEAKIKEADTKNVVQGQHRMDKEDENIQKLLQRPKEGFNINSSDRKLSPSWLRPSSDNGVEQSLQLVDPLGSAYILLTAISESRWGHAASAASIEIKKGGLEVDDTGVILDRTPRIEQPVLEGAGETINGIAFSSLCMLVAMALRGTRSQKILLLFHILLPPKQLKSTLSKHTFPTWILEDSSDIILSLSSIFYHHNTRKNSKILNVQACDTIAVLLYEFSTNGLSYNKNSSNSHYQNTFQSNNTHTVQFKGQNTYDFSKRNNLETILDSLRKGTLIEPFPHAHKFWNSLPSIFSSSPQFWSLSEFTDWADKAIDNYVLDFILHRIFGTGVLPSFFIEKNLVAERWLRWQRYEKNFWVPEGVINRSFSEDRYVDNTQSPKETKKSLFSKIFNGIGNESNMDGGFESIGLQKSTTSVWGGLGGVDGKGGLGHGVMYIVDKGWWDSWTKYVSWEKKKISDEDMQEVPSNPQASPIRPKSIANENLVDRQSASSPGAMGSFHALKPNLVKNVDYVIIPPGVWDIIYEIYGGGPPLPRMVASPSDSEAPELEESEEKYVLKIDDDDESFEIRMDVSGNSDVIYNGYQQVWPVPRLMGVEAYPIVFECHVCDPYQPYRRGDNGPTSIRVMATPSQPLWRLFSELLVRLRVYQARIVNSNGKGKARLWKKIDLKNSTNGNTAASSRYGPWSLLCKNRYAPFTVKRQHGSHIFDHNIEDWIEYADNSTVESFGLSNGSHIMMEFALISKSDTFVWPREAAAKAGREHRLADEDASFRQFLRGLDSNGKLLNPRPALIGTAIDAMDSTGRWYQAVISKVELWKGRNEKAGEKTDEDTEDDDTSEEDIKSSLIPGEVFRVRVEFKNSSAYDEWINVSSDRLAVKGRCTLTSFKNLESNSSANETANTKNTTDSKGNSSTSTSTLGSSRKINANGSSNSTAIESADANGNSSATICQYPGYGACGLANLGNTCYANAALQCMGYLPLMRAYLLSNSYKADLNKENVLGTGGRVLEEYADLLRSLWSGKYSAKAPSKFKQQLGRSNSQFAGNDQQDAQELLLAILDSLHEDSNKVRKKPAVPPMEDEWVNNTPVPRVGREAWWRYLRRNKSVITNTAMGQVMSRVTCPICDHSSLNFDPFGILSIPFPTANDVVFHFTLIRRASYTNCPFTLAKRKGSGESRETKNISNSPPSNHSIFEKYALSMSRLADIADLKLSLQNLTGIPVNKLKLYSRSEITPNAKNSSNSAEKSTALNSYFKVIPLPDKPGPCFQLAAKLKASSNSPDTPTEILAFESTLNPRPQLDTEVSTTSDEDSDESGRSVPPKTRDSSAEKQRLLEKQSKSYGDEKECFEFDSDPVALAKAMSRRLWPRNASDFSIGLRVDAIDQRKRWFSGSLVEIIESDSIDKKENGDSMRSTSEVKIHFDNFSPKWDEHYNIRHFRDKVRPLYSNAVPKINPIEFMVYHRRTNVPIEEKINEINLFGHPFMIECHSEWSTARTGAHIIAQASRFLQNKMKVHKSLLNALGRIDTDEGNELSKEDVYDRIVYEASVVVNDIIRVLIESDRRHVLTSAGIISERESRSKDSEKKRKRRSSTPGSSLRKKLASLLPKLPFEIRVCEFDVGSAQKGTRKITDEVLFPFSLVRTIGNFMTSQSSIILDWKDVSELFSRIIGYRKMSQSGSYPSFSYQEYPILYTQPKIEIHKESRSLLNENGLNEKKTANGNNDSGQSKKRGTTPDGGMKLDACLDEFCKELHAEGWTCPKCKKTREGRQKMTLWHLPDLLTFHIKRFNCNARWREKISTKVNFPLTGLNMKNWCDAKSPLAEAEDESTIYDLVGVINHYGGMTGGHYVAACKATQCSSDGVESVAHTFSGVGINTYEMEGETVQTGWRLGRNKDKDNTAVQSKIAMEQARGVADSCEPLWLQFDDDLVEPIPPRNVVSETAYVLFYRRRRLSPANIAKYTALD